MNGIHRNARIGHLVWGGLAALCLLLFMAARGQERAALTEQVNAAERRALRYADTVLYDALEARAVSMPITGTTFQRLHDDIRDGMLGDPLVARVRLWAPDGTLLFSTAADERGKIGRLRVNEDPAITAAAGGAASSRLATVPFTASTAGDPDVPTDLFETFVPLRVIDRTDVLGAVQIDQYYDAVRAAAAVPWRAVQWTCAGLAVLFGAVTLLSFRRRSAEIVAAPPAPASSTTASSARAAEVPVQPAKEAVAPLRAEPKEAAALSRAEHEEAVTALRKEHEEAVTALRKELAAATAAAAESERAAADARTEAATHLEAATAAPSAETERLADAEGRVAEAEDRATEAERRATDLEVMLAAAQREAQEATDEALAARTAPPSTAASLEAQALELLEARVIAAEERAADAEGRLAELGFEGPSVRSNGHPAPATNGQRAITAEADVPTESYPAELEALDGYDRDDGEPEGSPVFEISPEASDLRARLARSAALKKRSIEG